MKFSSVTFSLILSLSVAFLSIPVANAAGKIGYVDAIRLVDDSPQGKDAVQKLENTFSERNRELRAKFELFKEQEADLEKNGVLMSAEELEAKTRDLRDLQRELKRDQREYNEEYAASRNEGLAALQKLITSAVIDVAKELEYDIVLQQAVYASPGVDITAEVLKELEARHSSQ